MIGVDSLEIIEKADDDEDEEELPKTKKHKKSGSIEKLSKKKHRSPFAKFRLFGFGLRWVKQMSKIEKFLG